MKLNTVKLGLAAIAVIAAVLTSCRNDTPIPQIRETGGIKVVYPEGLTVISVKEDTLTFTNRTTGVSKKAAFGDTITLSNGLYDCFYNAVATYTDKQGTAADGDSRSRICQHDRESLFALHLRELLPAGEPEGV